MNAKDNYKWLCDEFDLEKNMSLRCAYLQEKIVKFLGKFENFPLIINKNNIAHLVIDYYTDIVRLKHFHGIKNTNKEKIVAYTAYWFCRRKPIQCTDTQVDEKCVFINEAFATIYICDELRGMVGGKEISDKFRKHIYYHLKYRPFDSKSIELMITAFREGACDNTP
jgi:hypothetical protein